MNHESMCRVRVAVDSQTERENDYGLRLEISSRWDL